MHTPIFSRIAGLILLAVATAVIPDAARADYTMVYESSGNPMMDGQFTIRVKGEMTRFDSPKMSTITNTAKSETIMLQHETKTVMKMPAGLAGEALKQAASPNATPAAPKLTPTGRKETINGHDCEEYIATEAGMNIVYWLAKNFPLKDELLHQSAVMNKNMGVDGLSLDPKSFPGFPIRTIINAQGSQFTTTLVSADTKPLPVNTFDIPAGYKEFEIPGGQLPFPGQ